MIDSIYQISRQTTHLQNESIFWEGDDNFMTKNVLQNVNFVNACL